LAFLRRSPSKAPKASVSRIGNLLPGVPGHGTIIDNFPKGPDPQGWTKRPKMPYADGYELVDQKGTVLFGMPLTVTSVW